MLCAPGGSATFTAPRCLCVDCAHRHRQFLAHFSAYLWQLSGLHRAGCPGTLCQPVGAWPAGLNSLRLFNMTAVDVQGGKLDDITVVLAMVDEELKPEEPLPQQSSPDDVASSDTDSAASSTEQNASEETQSSAASSTSESQPPSSASPSAESNGKPSTDAA